MENFREKVLYREGSQKGRRRVGGYNVFHQTSLPPHLRVYNPDEETYHSSLAAFKQVFLRGFALEVVQVYSGPPLISYKYRHWGYMEGPYKDYPPTGELVEMFGIGIFELNKESKLVKVEFFHDRGELLAALVKGKTSLPVSRVALDHLLFAPSWFDYSVYVKSSRNNMFSLFFEICLV